MMSSTRRTLRAGGMLQKLHGVRWASDRRRPTVLTGGFQPTSVTEKGVYMGSTFLEYPPQPLPQLDASVLLEPRKYCRKTAGPSGPTATSGGEAAKRLLEGRKVLYDVMRKELDDMNEADGERQYVLKGHGVPKQLLQHHVNAADMWIDRLSPNDRGDISLKLEAHVGHSDVDSMTIHMEEDKSWGAAPRTKKWPTMWQNDLDLFVAVMKRISVKMSQVLPFPDEYGVVQQECDPTLKCWAIKVRRRRTVPFALIPKELGLAPIIQCMPMSPMEGRIRLLLQGRPDDSDDSAVHPEAVSLTFDAIFNTR